MPRQLSCSGTCKIETSLTIHWYQNYNKTLFFLISSRWMGPQTTLFYTIESDSIKSPCTTASEIWSRDIIVARLLTSGGQSGTCVPDIRLGKWPWWRLKRMYAWRRHVMDIYPHYWRFVWGNHRSQGDSHNATVKWGIEVLFYVSLGELLNKQSNCLWFATLWCSRDLADGIAHFIWFRYDIWHNGLNLSRQNNVLCFQHIHSNKFCSHNHGHCINQMS